MNLYVVARYLHVVGALGFFVALGLEWARLAQLRRAQTAGQVREWAGIDGLRWVGPVSMLAVLIPGFYMAGTVWKGGAPWIALGLGGLVLVIILGVLSGRWLGAAIRAAAAEDGALSPATVARLRAPFPWISMQARTVLLLAIVFVMTAKVP